MEETTCRGGSENVIDYNCSIDIEIRLSDGLDKLKEDEVDSIVIAGMGGPLMVDIMKKGADICDEVDELILQPQSDIEYVRHFLEDNQYRIISEDIVFEDGKFYPMMKVIHGDMFLEKEIYYRYGKILLHEHHPILQQFLLNERVLWKNVLKDLREAQKTEKVEARIQEVIDNLVHVEEAIDMCGRVNPIEIERVIK